MYFYRWYCLYYSIRIVVQICVISAVKCISHYTSIFRAGKIMARKLIFSYDQVRQLQIWIGFQEICDYLIILRIDIHSQNLYYKSYDPGQSEQARKQTCNDTSQPERKAQSAPISAITADFQARLKTGTELPPNRHLNLVVALKLAPNRRLSGGENCTFSACIRRVLGVISVPNRRRLPPIFTRA